MKIKPAVRMPPDGPLVQWKNSGLLLRRIRVRVPGGPLSLCSSIGQSARLLSVAVASSTLARGAQAPLE